MNRSNTAKHAGNLAFFAYVLAGAFIQSKALLAVAGVSGSLAFWLYVTRYRVPISGAAKAILLAIAASYPFVFYNNDLAAGYNHGAMVLGSLGVAYSFAVERSYKIVLVTTLALFAYYLVWLAITGTPDNIFLGSRNRVSTLFLSLVIFLFALRRSRFDVAFAAAVFALSLSAEGSSGIIASSMLFASALLRTVLNFRRAAVPTKVAIAVIGIGASILVAFIRPTLIQGETEQKLEIERLLGDDVRYQIIDAYVEQHLHGKDLLIGVPLSYSFVVTKYGQWSSLENLHNSYLDLHSKTGVFSVVIFVAIAVRLLQLFRTSPFLAMLLLVLLTRAFADTVFILSGNYNFAFYAFFLPIRTLVRRVPERVGMERWPAVPGACSGPAVHVASYRAGERWAGVSMPAAND